MCSGEDMIIIMRREKEEVGGRGERGRRGRGWEKICPGILSLVALEEMKWPGARGRPLRSGSARALAHNSYPEWEL